MRLIIVALIDEGYGLGKDNKLLYRIKEDMKFFREITTNHYIVMGKNTFLSLNGLLPNRKHLVISTSMESDNFVKVYKSINDFLSDSAFMDEDVFVIGGGQIYKELLPYTDLMYLTKVHFYKEADAHFPRFDINDFDEELLGEYKTELYDYERVLYKRKQTKTDKK